MQSIERYGVVALLFLIVTVAAVLMWGNGERSKSSKGELAARARLETVATDAGLVRARAAAQPRAALTDARARARRDLGLAKKSTPEDRFGIPADGVGILTRDESARSATRVAGFVASASQLEAGDSGRGTLQGKGSKPLWTQALAPKTTSKAEPSAFRSRANTSRTEVPVYTVREGEVLGKIAQRELGTVKRLDEIIDLNPGLEADKIVAGLKLRMPENWSPAGSALAERGAAKSPVKASATSPRTIANEHSGTRAPAGMRAYIVAEGDSLWRIAERDLGSGARFLEIESANSNIKNGHITKGQTIFIPETRVAMAGRTHAAADSKKGERRKVH